MEPMARKKIGANLAPELIERLDALATRLGTTRNSLVAMLLAQGVKALEGASMSGAFGSVETATPVSEDQPYEPVPVDEPKVDQSKKHYHKFGPQHFVKEVEPVKGIRMGLYQCGCGEQKVDTLDAWSRAVVDGERK